jgi:hypothetical protein
MDFKVCAPLHLCVMAFVSVFQRHYTHRASHPTHLGKLQMDRGGLSCGHPVAHKTTRGGETG